MFIASQRIGRSGAIAMPKPYCYDRTTVTLSVRPVSIPNEASFWSVGNRWEVSDRPL